jgi:hypothetical protein
MTIAWPDHTYEVGVHYTQDSSLRPAVITFGVNYTGADFEADANLLCLDWVTTVNHSVADHFTCDRITFASVDGQVLDLAQLTPGGTSHLSATPNVTFLVRKITAEPGRRKRGRFYLPGVSEQDVDSVGVIAASKITEVQNNLNDFITAANGHRFFMCLIHKERAPKPGEEPLPVLPPTAVQSWRIDPLAATQRRRMRK